jgi:isopenicillin-N N-acyltransferase like protein
MSIYSKDYDLEQLTLRGSYRDIGLQYGYHFKAKIQKFVEMRLAAAEEYFKEWNRGSIDELLSIGASCWLAAQNFDPAGYEEQQGIADAIGISADRLYATCNMTDIRDVVLLPNPPVCADQEGCTSILVPPHYSQLNGGIYGQTWDLNPPDIEYIVALHRLPEQGLETWSITCTGCLTLVGMNEKGIAVGTTNLKTWHSQVGVGYLSVLHKAVSQSTLDQANDVLQNASVAGAHSYWLASKDGGIEWERSPRFAFKRDTQDGAITRSNHCLFEPHQKSEGVLPNESSLSRFARATTLLESKDQSIDSMKVIFSNREDGVNSINRYPEDEQGTTTNAVVLVDPANLEFHACRGSADRGTWYTFTFDRASK